MKKILVCNRKAVETKYGKMALVFWQQVNSLVEVSKTKGMDTVLICLDDKKDMQQYGLDPVTDILDTRQNKAAIDGIFEKVHPDCVVIVGAQDIIPFQILKDPTKTEKEESPYIPSDLPYCSKHTYSQIVSDFLPPTRMVTRLPDLHGATGEDGLEVFIETIKGAVSFQQKDEKEYQDILCLYAKQWERITLKTMQALAPSGKISQYASPPNKHPLEHNVLAHNVHFINLHGDKLDNSFYGQEGNQYPKALTADAVYRGIREGSVAVVLCCYGAQLYRTPGEWPAANAYLAGGAVMMGSTVLAITGPAEELGSCFLNAFRSSAKPSMQQAFLNARTSFIAARSKKPLDIFELKTLAEFVFYGDCGLPYIKGAAQENVANIQEEIAYIRENIGFAAASPEHTVPEVVRMQVEQDRREGNYRIDSEIRIFGITGFTEPSETSGWDRIRQYVVSMTDINEGKHHFVYTFEQGKITDSREYTEK